MNTLKLKYQSIEFKNFDIHLRTLKDTLQFSDNKNTAKDLGINDTLWAIFGVVWPSSLILAHLMDDYNFEDKTILEVGCGISLSSLVLNKRKARISATDYHPETEKFLNENILLNNDVKIDFFLSNWNQHNKDLKKFDLIIGSDLLYEDTHSKLLSKFINQHAKEHCEIILVSPVRGYQNDFNDEMRSNHFSHNILMPVEQTQLQKNFIGNIHIYKR